MRCWTSLLLLLVACSTGADRFDRTHLEAAVAERTGATIGPGDESLPPEVSLADGIQEDEGVVLALWRNAAFQEALAELGLRRADLVAAGEFPNPLLTVLFPIGDKQLELTAKLPFDFLWQRPARVAAARADCERLSALLVQGALDVVRDVHEGFADLRLARTRQAIHHSRVAVAEAIAAGQTRRFDAGDASANDMRAAQLQAMTAAAEAARADVDAGIAANRLRTLVGTPGDAECTFDERVPANPPPRDKELATLLAAALAQRPDLRSAELGVAAAGERVGLAKWEILSLTGIADANGSGSNFESGPGLEWRVPLLSQHQGAVDRAHAELERAVRHHRTVRDRVEFEVREARANVLAAGARLTSTAAMTTTLEHVAEQVRRAQAAGDESRLAAHLAELQLLDARLRDAEAHADLERSEARLIRSVGGRMP